MVYIIVRIVVTTKITYLIYPYYYKRLNRPTHNNLKKILFIIIIDYDLRVKPNS